MATVSYPPYYSQKITDNAGRPVAGGKILSYYAGSDVPLAVYTEDGTSLGAEVMINGAGEALFCLKAGLSYKLVCKDADGALVWTRDNVKVNVAEDGMANPMEAQADMIVGAVDGQPERLAAPSNASFLRSYKNSDNVPVVKWAQLKAGANVTITDAGTQVTVAADTQPGDHKVSADGTDTAGYLEDKIGAGSGISLATSAGKVVVSADTQPGDHKTAVDGADASPDYLAAKLAAGTGITLTNTGSAVEIAATAQTGDHQLLVSATDAASGYLGAKLTAGSNITLTTQTDGDGVQTLEISATGGGGGGGGETAFYPVGKIPSPTKMTFNNLQTYGFRCCYLVPEGVKISKIQLFVPDENGTPAFFDAATYKANGTSLSMNWHPTWTTNRSGRVFTATANNTHTAENDNSVGGEILVLLIGHGTGETSVTLQSGLALFQSTMTISGANYTVSVGAAPPYTMGYYKNSGSNMPATLVATTFATCSGTWAMPWIAVIPS